MLATILTLLASIAGMTGEVGVIAKIIEALTEIIPVAIKEYQALVPMVKGVIAALSANPATTADQLATLQAIDKQTDADFDAAAAAAEAEDKAAGDA